MNKKKLLIIDTAFLLFRSYYASIKSKTYLPKENLAIHTFFTSFSKTLQIDNFTDIVFAMESGDGSFRKQISPIYKDNRGECPEEISSQFKILCTYLRRSGMCYLTKSSMEADDVIASVVKRVKNDFDTINILSVDKDLMSLVCKNVHLYDPIKKQLMNEDFIIQKMGVKPYQISDYLSILGDSSDNIVGVKGLGKIAASYLLNKFNSIDEIYLNIDRIEDKYRKYLLPSRELLNKNISLIKLRDDLFDNETIISSKNNFSIEEFYSFCDNHDLSLLKRNFPEIYLK